jgi:hypothetical protein
MNRKSRLVKLSLGLVAALACTAAFVSTPAPASSACLVVCDGGFCCCGKVSGVDRCTGKRVCVSQCLSP